MGIMSRLAAKGLLRNRRRTLLTVLGISVTVALLSCAFHFFASYQEMMRREIIGRTGLWHVQYGEVDEDAFEVIRSDENTAGWFVQQDAFAFVGGSTRLSVTELSPKVIPDLGLTLLSGRLPEKPGEVVVTRTYGKLYPLDTVFTLEAGRRLYQDEVPGSGDKVLHTDVTGTYVKTSDRTYTVVGVVEPVLNDYGFAPIADIYGVFNESVFRPGETVELYVENRQVWGGVESRALDLAERAGVGYTMNLDGSRQYNVGYNGELLMTYGVTNQQGSTDMIVWMVLVFILVVMAAGGALIYNAFAISVSERTRQLGMLASVGATRRQRRRLVYFEGLLQALAGILLGLLLGVGLSLGAVRVISGILSGLSFTQYDLELVVSPLALAATAAVGFVTVFLAVLVPAVRAGRMAPIDAIRQTRDVKLKRRQVKTGWLARRLLRFPEQLGLKNLRRNRKRYRVTVISLSVSVVLFLTATSYLFYAEKAIAMENIMPWYDVMVMSPKYLSELDIDGMEKSLSVTAENGIWLQNDWVEVPLSEGQYQPNFLDAKEWGSPDTKMVRFTLVVLEERSLNMFLQQAGLTARPAWNEGRPTAILINGGLTRTPDGRPMEVEYTFLQPGDTLALYNDADTRTPEDKGRVTVQLADVITVESGEIDWQDVFKAPCLLVTEEVLRTVLQDSRMPSSAMGLYTVKEHELFCKDVKEYKQNGSRFSPIDYAEMYEAQERMLLAVRIGAYGFVGLITLLCAINMFGTLSTGMNLRRRELAMLKSVGMTRGAVRRMLAFESVCYGLKTLAVGLPVSFAMDVLLYRLMQFGYVTRFSFPWTDFLIAAAAVLLLTWLFMLAAFRTVKKQNLVEELRLET